MLSCFSILSTYSVSWQLSGGCPCLSHQLLSSSFREKFIPITRRSVIRHLMQEKDFLNEREQKEFERLALALDAAIVNRHHDILQDLKVIVVSKKFLTAKTWTFETETVSGAYICR